MTDKNYEDGAKPNYTSTASPNHRALLVKKIWVKPGLIINLSAGNQHLHGLKPYSTTETTTTLGSSIGPS